MKGGGMEGGAELQFWIVKSCAKPCKNPRFLKKTNDFRSKAVDFLPIQL
jgi:hypothetical protein